MNRRRRIYEGKAKILYEGPEPGTLIQFFKDDATAFNKKKHEVVDGKGVLNNRISEHIFTQLNRIGIPTHFIRRLNMREQLIREVEIIPLEIVVRNVAAGSLAKRLGIEEGTVLPRSIIEFYYKADALDDPMVTEEHITAFGWASPQEIDAVHIGQPARLRLTALNARLTPEVGGVITDISADRLVDQTTHEVYYRARLRFADELPPGVMAEQLYPGMPVEAYIDAGERTFFGYLVRPIRDSLSRALKEE